MIHFRGLLLCACALVGSAHGAEYTLVAAPRGSEAEERTLYEPIAELLSKAGGEPVRYVYIGDWLSYRKAVDESRYTIYFNGPHFSAWLAQHRGHQYLARLKESHTFVVAARVDNGKIRSLSDLAGRTACLHPEPNLGTLIFLSGFPNAYRQPVTVQTTGWKASFEGMMAKRCMAAVLPITNFDKFNKEGNARIVHQFATVPNQAFTANDTVPTEVVERWRSALLSRASYVYVANLLNVYASKGLVGVDAGDYALVGDFLQGDFVLGRAIGRDRSRRVAAPVELWLRKTVLTEKEATAH